MMTKTQKQIQSEQTRQQIIDAATLLFVRKGFFGTSIADLAEAAGLTKGALYHHFENKDALFFAVIKSVRDVWNKKVAREVLSSKDALDRLIKLIENHTILLVNDPQLCLLFNGLVMEMDGINPKFMVALQDVYTDLIDFIESIIQKGQSAGQIRSDIDAHLVALNIVSILRGIGCSPIFKHMGVDSAEMIEALKPIIIDGLKP